jgi:transposase
MTEGATSTVLPEAVRSCIDLILGQIADLQTRVQAIEKVIRQSRRMNEVSLRLQTIPGSGVITASAITATTTHANPDGTRSVESPTVDRRHQDLQVWATSCCLDRRCPKAVRVWRQSPCGENLQEGAYLRKLLVLGATAVIRYCRNNLNSQAGLTSSFGGAPRAWLRSRLPTGWPGSLGW